MKKMTIFLTGGSGFIGKHIHKAFKKEYIILAPTHNELDLLDEKTIENYFKKHVIDIVIHTANIGGTRNTPFSTQAFENNLRMFFNLARLEKYFSKFIFLGSGAEYDKRQSLVQVKEIDFDTFVPLDSYGYYKYLCSKYIEKSNKIINLRLFGVFGPYEDYSTRFISQALCKSILDMPISINRNVDFTYLYIDDLMKILSYFLSSQPKYNCYNIGPLESIDLLSLAKKIKTLTNNPHSILVKNRKKGNAYTADTMRLFFEISNLQFTPLDTSLQQLHTWYLTHRKSIDPHLLLSLKE